MTTSSIPRTTLLVNAAFFAVVVLFFWDLITTNPAASAEIGNFLTLSIVSLLLIILGKRRVRIYSTLIFTVCLFIAYYGNQRSLEYHTNMADLNYYTQMNNRILERK